MTIRTALYPAPSSDSSPTHVWAWRHPRPIGAEGLCIGRTDLKLDPRKARRLARQIATAASRYRLSQVVYTSSLHRCASVGKVLGNWGWEHRIDDALREFDFGLWEGKAWIEIGQTEVQAWTDSFAHYAPGGGETLAAMLQRAAAWSPGLGQLGRLGQDGPGVVVAHAGWLQARQWQQLRGSALPTANEWPQAPRYGQLCQFAG